MSELHYGTVFSVTQPPDVSPSLQVRSLTVAIPAFNEEKNIVATVQSVLAASAKTPELNLQILIVDDGSSDKTAEISEELANQYPNVQLVRNPQNIGLGASIRRAIQLAETDKFLFIPGDNDISSSALEALIGKAYMADMVMIYFHNDERRGRMRYLLSTVFKVIYTTAFDLYVHYINGPAVYPLSRLRDLHLHSTRFSIVAEINVKLMRQGLTFIELPADRQVGMEGSTSFSLRTLLETARVFIQVFFDVHVRDRARYSKRPQRCPYCA